MVIQILTDFFEEGYLKKNQDSLISLFFPGSNVAFRRKVFEDVGLYDINCVTGEDQDICIRVANSAWERYYQPKAVVGHKSRQTAKAFLKQWYRYGLYHPYVFKKHNSKSLMVYLKKRRAKKGILYERAIYKKPFPLFVLIFITPFLIMNMFLLLTVLSVLLGFNILSIILGLVTLGIGICYFRPDMAIKRPWRTVKFILLRYLVNLAILVGGFLGGAKSKMMYICPTFDYRKRGSQ